MYVLIMFVKDVVHEIINFDNKILKYILFVLILLRSLSSHLVHF